MQSALAILTTHFGTNFSGGSTATCEIFSRLESEFSEIYVIANELGQHPFKRIQWLRYRTTLGAIKQIQSLDTKNTVFYGDFYNAYLLTLLNKPFYFTYHDNWPELESLGWQNRLKSYFYWPLYRRIFKQAEHVVTVSDKKLTQLNSLTPRVSLIRNGFSRQTQTVSGKARKNVLMVGNIDTRKYVKAIELFSTLPVNLDFDIHIYGHSHDPALVNSLKNFPFVHLKGYQSSIPYADFALLLHTSVMENSSIVWCESLFQKTRVLTFDVGAAKEIIGEDTGWCVVPYDICAMKSRLLEHMHHPVPIDQKPDILTQFDWQIASKQYKALMIGESATHD